MLANLSAKIGLSLSLTIWVVISLVVGQIVGQLIVLSLNIQANVAVLTTVAAVLGYTLGIVIAVGGSLAISSRRMFDKKSWGIDRLPSWSDIGLGVLAVLPYFVLASVVIWIGTDVVRLIDPEVGQQQTFTNLYLRIEYIVAFFTLVILAPIAEEFLFRGFFQGKATKYIGSAAGVILVAAIFGLMHLIGFTEEGGVVLQWGAAADTFALGLAAGILRLITGSIWAGVILHAIKNGIAYYFLFIYVAG